MNNRKPVSDKISISANQNGTIPRFYIKGNEMRRSGWGGRDVEISKENL